MVADRKIGFQNLEKTVEILNDRNSARHDLAYQLLSSVGGDVVVEPDKLGQHPIQNRSNERRILQIWVNSISKVRGIAFVADVID